MCITAILQNSSPNVPLVVCHNRDEFHERKCSPLKRLNEGIYAGVDESSQGHWLSVTDRNTNTYAVIVLNYRNMGIKREDLKSRGELVKKLTGLKSADLAISVYKDIYDKYNHHTILIINKDEVFTSSSFNNHSMSLSSGNHTFSNGLIEEKPWPKQSRLKKLISEGLSKTEPPSEEILSETLFSILKDDKKANIGDLPNTFVGEKMEHFLSSIFIKSSSYGTRSSTIIQLRDNTLYIRDFNYDREGKILSKFFEKIKLN